MTPLNLDHYAQEFDRQLAIQRLTNCDIPRAWVPTYDDFLALNRAVGEARAPWERAYRMLKYRGVTIVWWGHPKDIVDEDGEDQQTEERTDGESV